MVKKPFSRFIAIITGKDDPESGDPLTLEARLSRLERFGHFCFLLGQSFVRNRCFVRAAALSFVTLLALIPMLAVVMSVTTGVLKTQGEDVIYGFIDKVVASIMPPGGVSTNDDGKVTVVLNPLSPPAGRTNLTVPSSLTNFTEGLALGLTDTNATMSAATNVLVAADKRVVTAQKESARYIHEFIQKSQSGTLGVTGMIVLIIVAIRMLVNIEAAFNDIWGVVRGRSWAKRIWQYWGVITLGPLLLAGAIGTASGPHFQSTRHFLDSMPVTGFFIQLLPLAALWVVFALFYEVVPNTRVQFSAALAGGIVAGTLLHLVNVCGFLFVSRLTTYSKIYGGLGLVPVFMLGLYLSWTILLFGAQVAYAYQNRAAYLQEKLADNVNQRGREFIALRLMTCIGHRFQNGLPPVTVPEMSKELGIPSKLIQQVLRTLLNARLVVEITKLEPAYAPARPLNAINAHHVLMALRAAAGQELFTRDEPVRAEIYGEFARIQEAEKQAASSVTLLDLVIRAKARLELEPPAAKNEPVRMVAALTPPADAIKNKPAPSEPVEVAAVAEKVERKEPGFVLEEEPVIASTATPENISPVTARSSSDENESFPL